MSREEASYSTRYLLQPTADPAVTDSTLGDGIIVNVSLDSDLRKWPQRTSLPLCLSCLYERVGSIITSSCCSDIHQQKNQPAPCPSSAPDVVGAYNVNPSSEYGRNQKQSPPATLRPADNPTVLLHPMHPPGCYPFLDVLRLQSPSP